jgi:hypothetical protein
MKYISLIGLGCFLILFLSPLACGAGATSAPVLVRVDNPSPREDGGFGRSVAGLSDIDGDGARDFAVGAPGQDEVFLFSGSSRTLIRTIPVPSVPGYRFGWSVREMGDVDGDGIADIAVSAPNDPATMELPIPCTCDITGDPCPPECTEFPFYGRIFVFSGATGGLLWEVKYLHPFLGYSLVSPGDLNGDTVPDLIASAPSFSNAPRIGKIYALSGADGSILWEAWEPAPGPDQPRQELASFGMRMAGIADVSGVGTGDLLVSSPFFDCNPDPAGYPEGANLCGRAFVLDMKTGAVIRTIPDPRGADNDGFGLDLSSLGDQDADGIADYLVGSHGIEKVTLFSAAGGGVLGEISRPGGGGMAHFGYGLSGTDDKDGDAVDDFWVSDFGGISLMNGRGELLLRVNDPDPASPVEEGSFGVSLSPLHDLDGDLSTDLLAGDALETVGGVRNAGAAYLVLGVRINTPPVADAGPDQLVGAGADCSATVTLDGTGSWDPDGDTLAYEWAGSSWTATGPSPRITLPPGHETITLSVQDGNGGTASDTVGITVLDTSPPSLVSLEADPGILWPPNHQMVPVRVLGTALDNCDPVPSCSVTRVESSEPVLGTGDDTSPDWLVTGGLTLRLRAERSGRGTGRTYTVSVDCLDNTGNRAERKLTIIVPHDPGKSDQHR